MPLPISFQDTHCNNVKPWHRIDAATVDPELLRKYLGWRPLEIVKATIEETTHLPTQVSDIP